MNTPVRDYGLGDRALLCAQGLLRALAPPPVHDAGDFPGADEPEPELGEEERRHVAGLVRVDHAGEVCAQALYLGQALVARDPELAAVLQQAGEEEAAHLRWCRQRLAELDAHVSRLDPAWYLGALAIGIGAALAGDRFSLGFLAETERQVVEHLADQMSRLPATDGRTRALLMQMQRDEARHATTAVDRGAAMLPWPIPQLMRAEARVMTTLAYWL